MNEERKVIMLTCRNMLSETDQSNCSSSGSTPNLSDSLAMSCSSVFSATSNFLSICSTLLPSRLRVAL